MQDDTTDGEGTDGPPRPSNRATARLYADLLAMDRLTGGGRGTDAPRRPRSDRSQPIRHLAVVNVTPLERGGAPNIRRLIAQTSVLADSVTKLEAERRTRRDLLDPEQRHRDLGLAQVVRMRRRPTPLLQRVVRRLGWR